MVVDIVTVFAFLLLTCSFKKLRLRTYPLFDWELASVRMATDFKDKERSFCFNDYSLLPLTSHGLPIFVLSFLCLGLLGYFEVDSLLVKPLLILYSRYGFSNASHHSRREKPSDTRH
jgi:hypothetical protein